MLLLESLAEGAAGAAGDALAVALQPQPKAATQEFPSVAKMLNVSVKYCLSLGRVAGSGDVSIGRVGYLNSWQRRPFSFRFVDLLYNAYYI